MVANMVKTRFLASFVALSIIALACIGCSSLRNATNRGGLEEDVKALCQERAKVNLYKASCHMVGTTRAGICEFKALPQDINAIANSLDMSEIKSDKTLKYANTYGYDIKSSKLGGLFSQGKDVRAYGIFGRPAKLKLKNGSAFEYMILFYEPATNEASLETCYSYG
jgi:hypothetical protein